MLTVAERQHGVVSRAQLLDLGLSASAIGRRVRSGRLHVIHPGVYAAGRPGVGRRGLWVAAVLRCDAAVLGFRSAGQLWGILRERRLEPVEIIARHSGHSTPRLRRHRIALPRDEVTMRDRVPVTSLARTVFDLSSRLEVYSLLGVLREAQFRRRLDLASVAAVAERRPGHRGAVALSACLVTLGSSRDGRTRSPLEDRFASFVARHRLPEPEHNVLVELGDRFVEADCLYRDQRLIVELDGRAEHGTDAAFQLDRSRDRRLLADGWRTIRVTHAHLDDPAPLLADLRVLLGSGEIPDGPGTRSLA